MQQQLSAMLLKIHMLSNTKKILCIIVAVYWEQEIASLGFMFDKYIAKQAINFAAGKNP